MTAGPRRRLERGGSIAALLLAALVLFSGLDFHPAGEAHDELTGVARQVYYPGASHPHARHHAEAGQAADRPLCPACLNRLQTSGAHQSPALQLPPPTSAYRLPSLISWAPLARSQRPRGGRAPPLA